MAEPNEHGAYEADFSDYYEGTLPAPRRAELDAHFASCPRCRNDYKSFCEAVGALSGLHHEDAPQHFEKRVTETIHRRSAGRFFGRRAFGDRVPFELIGLVGLVLMILVLLMVRWSDTGSVHTPLRHAPTTPAPTPPIIPAP